MAENIAKHFSREPRYQQEFGAGLTCAEGRKLNEHLNNFLCVTEYIKVCCKIVECSNT